MAIFDGVIRAIDRQKWLDPVADAVEKGVKRALKAGGGPGQAIANFLNGTWLGHPLHALLTDIPVGAWSVAIVLDTAGLLRRSDVLNLGADWAVGIGLMGAAGSVLTGVADWHHTYPAGPRRTGLAHGLLNLTATVLYAAALVLRLQGARTPGIALAYGGYAVLAVGAYVGGHLSHALRVGVNQAVEVPELQPDHTGYVPVMADKDLKEGKLTQADMKGFRVVLVRRGATVHALADLCSHLGCSLAEEGKVEGDELRCTCHGSRFSLTDGRVLQGPATFPQPCFSTRVREGMIEVRAAAQAWSAVPTPAEERAEAPR